jgi:hypothetical protein
MAHLGKILMITGLVLTACGGIIWLFGVKLSWFGNLPGDIKIVNDNVRFYFPITTMILVSLLLSGFLWVVRFIMRAL